MAGFTSRSNPPSTCIACDYSLNTIYSLQGTTCPIKLTFRSLKYNNLKRLYDLSRWPTLTQSFRLAIYTLNTLPTEPLLHLALYAGLASLKLPTCYDHPDTKNVDCPVCDKALGKLAEEVPFSHHVNSTIVCRISGKIMDEDNMPLAFPETGNVYSREVCANALA